VKLIKRAEITEEKIGEAVLLPLPEGVIPVDNWEPEPEDIYATFKGKTFIIEFDKIFKRNTITDFNYFDISMKEAYYKRLDMISLYINYFIKFYDPDKELIMAYLRLKYLIDAKHISRIKRNSFIKTIQKTMFTDSMCEKIKKMSMDNYHVDLSSNEKSKKGANNNYAEVLQFNEHHAEILMRISIAIKFVIPVVLHFIKTYYGKPEVKSYLYKYYEPLFKNKILTEDVNILGKLYCTIATRVNSHSKPDKAMYDKHEVLGSSVETFIDTLFHKNIITDTVFLYKFKGNIINYNSVILKLQLRFHSKEDLKRDFLLVSIEKEPDGLSGMDKLEMYITKLDEFSIIFSQVNIADTINKIKEKIKIKITDEEIEFYKTNHDFNTISKDIVFYFFAKWFNGYQDLNFVKRNQYIELLIIMKRMLEASGIKYLSQIITANVNGKSSSRIIRNSKFLEKITSSPVYVSLIQQKYPSFDNLSNNPIISLLSKIINMNWKIVDYDLPDMLDETLDIDNDILASEFLNFVNNI
jgi:hypothetical protein